MSTASKFTIILVFPKCFPGECSEGEQLDVCSHMQARATCLRKLAGYGPAKSALRYFSVDSEMVICEVDANAPPRAPDIAPVEVATKNIQCRVYQGLPILVTPKVVDLHRQGLYLLVVNAMTPAPDQENDFNRWYDEEHLALLSRSPHWFSSKRYVLTSATDSAPQYLATHAWGDVEAFTSEEYKHATNTEWRQRVVDRVLQKDRKVYGFVGKLNLYE